jgi:undecaprenyl diphosphate synthase
MLVPNHLGIILDGNRRWARARGMPGWVGHRHGAETFEKFLNWCLKLKIPQVSVYALSTENLNRSKTEVNELFRLFKKYLKKWEKDGSVLDKHEVRVNFCGNLRKVPDDMVKIMEKLMQKTAKYQKRVLNFLVAYGSYFELINVFKKIVAKVLKSGRIQITSKDIQKNLLVPTPIDLIIRTGGMSRLSNFLLWQAAYAEIYVTPTLWPDFSKKELIRAIKWFNKVQRRFGR